MNFSSEHLTNVFSALEAEGTSYGDFKLLMFDCAKGELEEGISKKDANDKIRNVVFNILGLDKNSSKREIKRAMKRHGHELFEVIEDVIDIQVATGFKESEFFNEFVDMRNLALGDSQEFWTDEKVLLSVHRVSGDHHDIALQRLGEGESYTVPTSTYAIAIGENIDLYLTGRIDWAKMVDACASAFVRKIQADIYAEVMAAGNKVPSSAQFNKTMAITAANKDTFDELIEDVSTANECPVVIMGTRTALKKLNAFADVDWISNTQKEEVAEMGRLGRYEGTLLVEIPQRFKDNDVATKLVDSKKLLIMPQVENKFVKMVDVGETEVLEVMNKGDRQDDTQKYEVQRSFGVATQIGRYFGTWTIV